MGMEYIRKYYGVPAKRGGRIRFAPGLNSGEYASSFMTSNKESPREGTIKSASNSHIMILLDGDKRPMPYHPTWRIEYLEGNKERKPLFIPLNTEYYEAFKDGSKTEELRIYGPRWNHDTCQVGREVVISKGYGKKNRMKGRIWRFKKQHGSLFGSTYKAAIEAVYGTLDVEIACISITDMQPVTEE